MGLLDDAIREHLELKRRRGADPSEIERLEREALGPVRRPGYEANEIAAGDEPAVQLSQPDDQPTEFWPAPGDEPEFADHGAEFVREAEDWGASDIAETVLEPEVAPPAPQIPSPPQDPPHDRGVAAEDEFLEQETVEHDVEVEYEDGADHGYSDPRDRAHTDSVEVEYPEPEPGHPGSPGQDQPRHPEREDMLEETPEFLQDTPDHDRLWFEQRPPRDFDLDG
jgi:hypothetical protein